MNEQSVRTVMMACLCWASTFGWAQDGQQPVDFGAQRQAIQAERARAVGEFEAESANCQSRFAVTDCQLQVQARRRVVESQFRRQESLVNEEERLQRVQEQRAASAVKAQERLARAAEKDADARWEKAQELQQSQREKQLAHQQQLEAGNQSKRFADEVRTATGPAAAQQAANRSAYASKHTEVQRRRNEAEEERKKRGTAKPGLPLPP